MNNTDNTSQPDAISRIEGRIRKLLALSGNNPNEDEAVSAAAKAAELALKHGIDLAAARRRADAEEDPVGMLKSMATPKIQQWICVIARAVAALNGVKSVIMRQTADSPAMYLFVGRPAGTSAASETLLYLCRAVVRLGKSRVAEFGLTRPERRAFRMSYRVGASMKLEAALNERLQALRDDDTLALAATGSTALVVAGYFDKQQADIEAAMEARGLKAKNIVVRPKISSAVAAAMGYQDAKNIGLDAQVAASPGAAAIMKRQEG